MGSSNLGYALLASIIILLYVIVTRDILREDSSSHPPFTKPDLGVVDFAKRNHVLANLEYVDF